MINFTEYDNQMISDAIDESIRKGYFSQIKKDEGEMGVLNTKRNSIGIDESEVYSTEKSLFVKQRKNK